MLSPLRHEEEEETLPGEIDTSKDVTAKEIREALVIDPDNLDTWRGLIVDSDIHPYILIELVAQLAAIREELTAIRKGRTI